MTGPERYSVVAVELEGAEALRLSLGAQAAERLLAAAKREIARLAGDVPVRAFSNALAVHSTPGEAAQVAARIGRRFRDPVIVDDLNWYVGVSVGIAHGADRGDVERVERNAAVAAHEAARRGDLEVVEFDAALAAGVRGAYVEQQELRRALRGQEITVHYQPIRAVDTGTIVAYEALARWQHPTAGLLAAGRFVPRAERTALIGRLGERVLDVVLGQAAHMDGGAEGLRFTVNVAAPQLARPSFAADLEAAVAAAGVPAERLVLELTESTLLGARGHTLSALEQLRASGMGLVVDDFGAGHSSLTYLQRLPVTGVKFDRALLPAEPDARRVVSLLRTLIDLSHELGIPAVAEGVEHPWQLELLRELGCTYAQGFGLGRPAPGALLDPARDGG